MPREKRNTARRSRLPVLAERVIVSGGEDSLLSLISKMARVQLGQKASLRPSVRAAIEVVKVGARER